MTKTTRAALNEMRDREEEEVEELREEMSIEMRMKYIYLISIHAKKCVI